MFRIATAAALIVLVSATTFVAAFSPSLTTTEAPEDASPEFRSIGERIHEEMQAHGHAHAHGGLSEHPTVAAYPLGLDPVARARDALTLDVYQGRTAKAWVASLDADRLLALDMELPEADLASQVLRLHALVGLPASPQVRADVHAQAEALPSSLRQPFAGLVAVVVDEYEAHQPLVHDVLARLPDGLQEESALLSPEERDVMVARGERVVAAVNAWRASVAQLDVDAIQPLGAGPLFKDPFGLVVLGGPGDDVHERTPLTPALLGHDALDPVLLVDLGGNDAHRTSAGAACPEPVGFAHECNLLSLSVLVDVAGDDLYEHDGAPAAVQGAGSLGGIGILVDAQGDDRYLSTMTRTDRGPLFSYIDGGAQGFAQAGYGLLLDAEGHDEYRADVATTGRSIWDFAQGFGSLGGVGILADAQGHDYYRAYGLGDTTGRSFQGVYNNGVGFYGGVGILSDTGMGDDRYHAWNNGTTVDYYAQGFGAFGGLGILYEDGGDDDYIAVEVATDPFIDPLLNCAFGTGSLGGVGIMLEMGGDDRYYGESRTPKVASVMNEGYGGIGSAYGLLVDVSGDDGHFMVANGNSQSFTAGRGVLLVGGNIAGNYLDMGGADTYVGAGSGLLLGGSRDGGFWIAGADYNAPNPLASIGWST